MAILFAYFIYLRYNLNAISNLGVAQFGSAPDWGSGGRKFKSCHPDQNPRENSRGFLYLLTII